MSYLPKEKGPSKDELDEHGKPFAQMGLLKTLTISLSSPEITLLPLASREALRSNSTLPPRPGRLLSVLMVEILLKQQLGSAALLRHASPPKCQHPSFPSLVASAV